MKKFDIKKLLILMLALLLVFALVACDKKDDQNDTPGPGPGDGGDGLSDEEAYNEYFNNLWNSTKSLNDVAFAEGDDLGLSLDLSVEIAVADKKLALGIAAQLIVDRGSDADGGYNAAKVQLYNGKTGENWLTLYYFLDEADVAYVEFADQKLKVNFDLGYNSTWADTVNAFLGNKQITIGGKNFSIQDFLNLLVRGSGDKWTLDSLVFGLTSTLGLDLEALIKQIFPSFSAGGEMVSLVPVLETLGPAVFGVPTQQTIEGGTYHSAAFKELLPNMLVTMIPVQEVKDILSGMEMTLGFGVVDGEIDGLDITAKLPAATNSDGQAVTLKISINELEIKNLGEVDTAAKATTAFGIDKADYKPYFELDLSVTLKDDGALVVNNPAAVGTDKSYVAEGEYTLSLKGFVDLANLGVDNKTVAVATLAYKNGAESKVVAKASYKANGQTVAVGEGEDAINVALFDLAVEVYNDVNNAGGESIVKAFAENLGNVIIDALKGSANPMIKGAGDALEAAVFTHSTEGARTGYNTSFEGFAITDINHVQLFRDLIQSMIVKPAEPTPDPAAGAAAATTFAPKDPKAAPEFPFSINVKEIVAFVADNIVAGETSAKLVVPSIIDALCGSFKKDTKTGAEAIKTAEDLNALMFARSQAFIKAFTDCGYLETVVIDNVVYYKNADMITREEAVNMWMVAIGEYTLAEFNALLLENATDLTADQYTALQGSLLPAFMKGFFAGSVFVVEDKDAFAKLFDAALEVGIGFDKDNGFTIGVKGTLDNATLEIGVGIKVKALDTVPVYETLTVKAAGANYVVLDMIPNAPAA